MRFKLKRFPQAQIQNELCRRNVAGSPSIMRKKFLRTAALAFAALAFLSGLRAADSRIPIEITEKIKAATPVHIVSDNPEFQRLATTAFGAHGAFRVDQGGDAKFTLRFSAIGGTSVRAAVESGRPARTLFTQDVSGTSPRNALLRAADAVVTYITKEPGFFSGKLTFVSTRTGASEIYVSDLFFGDMVQLTHDRSQSVTPRWAPDGRRILYTSYFQNGAPDIYLIDTATNQRSSFVSVRGTNTGARFSPDGSRVAMILSGEGNPEVYVSNAQGRGIRRLTRTQQIEATPTWSPDGSELIVASDAVATNHPQLYRLSASGGALRRIPSNVSGYCAEPDWSHANRDRVAFTAAVGSRPVTYQIAVFKFSEGGATILTQGPGDCISPCWTNDGRHLLYTERQAGRQRICLLDTETRRSTPLSPTSLVKAYQANFIKR